MVNRFSTLKVVSDAVLQSENQAQDVHAQLFAITQADREKLNGHEAKVIWLTGLSGSGKSTIANALELKATCDGKALLYP